MAAEKVKIIIKSIEVLDDCDFFGAGEWMFKATVKRVASGETIQVGDPEECHEVNNGDNIDLNWSTDLDIKPNDTKIEIGLDGKDSDLIWDDELGKIKVILNTPITHSYDLHLRSSEDKYVARVKVDVLQDSGGKAPGSITTILQRSDSDTYNTINDEMLDKMVHICPVIPVPWATGIPPIAKGVQTMSASPQVDLSIPATETKLNSLVNPALIPVISTTDADFNDRCARIRITQYRPATLDLSKLIWTAATDNIKFWAGGSAKTEVKGGIEVKAFGVLTGNADQEGKIEVRWDVEGKPLLAVYRAWVGKPKYIWCRANIIKTSATTSGGVPVMNPTLTPAQVKRQIEFCNIFLWQSGLEMVMDDDGTCYNGAVKKQTGIFEVTTTSNYTFNVTDDPAIVAPLLNLRSGVFNIAYIHSVAGSPGLYGMATDRRLSEAEAMVNLAGSPSTSWVRPTGVFPDDAAKQVSMKRMGPSTARQNSQKPLAGDQSIGTICACIMTQFGAVTPGSVTLSHELGHVIGLHHRGCGGGETVHSYDKVDHMAGPRKGRGHPWEENLMTYGPNSRRQDVDMIQTMVIRGHKLLKDNPPAGPGPTPVPPKTKEPVPTAWLPTTADKILMQEYLCNKKKGLKHTGYDLGTSGPDGDGVDGIVGPKTRAAVRQFQTDHGGLSVDGIYGPNTHDAFDQEINGP